MSCVQSELQIWLDLFLEELLSLGNKNRQKSEMILIWQKSMKYLFQDV